MRDKLFEQGLKLRKQVLGAEYVERQLKNGGFRTAREYFAKHGDRKTAKKKRK